MIGGRVHDPRHVEYRLLVRHLQEAALHLCPKLEQKIINEGLSLYPELEQNIVNEGLSL